MDPTPGSSSISVVKWMAFALAGLLAVFLAVGLLLPGTYAVERSVLISAPGERIHPRVDDLRQWVDWAGWERADPMLVSTFTGPERGVGQRWSWRGPELGEGVVTIVRSDPATGVWLQERSGGDSAQSSITWSKEGDHTRVVWHDQGTLPPVVGGYIRPVVERRRGAQFQRGLARLKTLVENSSDGLSESSTGL